MFAFSPQAFSVQAFSPAAFAIEAAPVPEAIEYQHLPVTRPLMLRLGRALVHPEHRQVAQRRSTLRLRP